MGGRGHFYPSKGKWKVTDVCFYIQAPAAFFLSGSGSSSESLLFLAMPISSSGEPKIKRRKGRSYQEINKTRSTHSLRVVGPPQLILPALSDIITPSCVSSSSRPFPSPSLSNTRSYASATMEGWMGTLFFASMRMMLETRAMD